MSLFNTHNGSARTVHLFQYLLLGFLFLTAVSLLGRILFVCLVSYEFVDMAFSEVVYALLWGLRFDFAAAAILTTFIAVTAIAIALSGYLYEKLKIPQIVLFVIGGIMLLVPRHTTQGIGFLLIMFLFAWEYIKAKRRKRPS